MCTSCPCTVWALTTSYGLSVLSGTTGCWPPETHGDDIFLEGTGRSPNWGIRVRVLHCANWQALQRLPRPHGNFLRGYLASTTLIRLTSLGKLLKQQDSAHRLCIQCFKAIITLFVALDYMLLYSCSRCSTFGTTA